MARDPHILVPNGPAVGHLVGVSGDWNGRFRKKLKEAEKKELKKKEAKKEKPIDSWEPAQLPLSTDTQTPFQADDWQSAQPHASFHDYNWFNAQLTEETCDDPWAPSASETPSGGILVRNLSYFR